MTHIFLSLLALFFVFLNAFFVAAEFGMVKLRSTQVLMLKEANGFKGKILYEIHKNLDAYLSACQLGITIASLALGWIGEPAVADLIEPLLNWIGVQSPDLISFISFAIAFSIISFLHIVLGELMPKSLAIRRPESISLITALPLYGFYWIMYPAIWCLNASSNFLLKLTHLDFNFHAQHVYSTEEIKLILGASHSQGELTKDETDIIEHTLEFADLDVTDVMRPRDEMVAFDIKDSVSNIIKKVNKFKYSRYPIFTHNMQEPLGVLLVKDLFYTLYKNPNLSHINAILRPIIKVPENLPAIELLQKFRTGPSHFALIYRYDAAIIGFVTLDNLLQVMIGKIRDEFHRTKVSFEKEADGSLVVDGDCPVYSIERELDISIYHEKEDENFTTITGLIFHKLNRFPIEGEIIEFNDFKVIVLKIRGSRIETLKIKVNKTND